MKLGRIINKDTVGYAKNLFKFVVGTFIMFDGYGNIMANIGEKYGYQKHVNETYTDAVNKQISRYSGDKGDCYILGLSPESYSKLVSLGKENKDEA